MCLSQLAITICEGCANICTSRKPGHQCFSSTRTGRMSYRCPFHVTAVDLIFLQNNSNCIYCDLGTAPPSSTADQNWRLLRHLIARRVLTQQSDLQARSLRRPWDPFGPVYMNIARRDFSPAAEMAWWRERRQRDADAEADCESDTVLLRLLSPSSSGGCDWGLQTEGDHCHH